MSAEDCRKIVWRSFGIVYLVLGSSIFQDDRISYSKVHVLSLRGCLSWRQEVTSVTQKTPTHRCIQTDLKFVPISFTVIRWLLHCKSQRFKKELAYFGNLL